MTEMSDPHRPLSADLAPISARPQGRSALARPLHDAVLPVSPLALPLLLAASGCVFPPDLSVSDGDAGVNSPPAILTVRSDQQELPEPGPVTFERGSGTLTVTLYDTDVDDRLFVRVFVNYRVVDPTPPRATCTAPPTGSTQRTAACDLTALCQREDVNAEPNALLMQINVFDREVLETGSPSFKAMPPGGLTTSRIYQLDCLETQQ